MYLLSAQKMREMDALAMSMGISSEVLMENAASATVDEILKENPKKVIIFTGKGQNAGDGFAIARRLFVKGIDTEVITLFKEEALSGAAKMNFDILKNIGVPVSSFSKDKDYNADVFVDCLLGTGARGNLAPEFASAAKIISESGAYVISADIPSGISADNGKVLGTAVKADKTVTYGFLKAGLFSPLSKDYVGEIVLSDISIPQNIKDLKDVKTFLSTKENVYFPPSSKSAHKGSNGKVLIAGGNRGMCGAVFMAAESAAAVGAGLITCAVPTDLMDIFMSRLTFGMCKDIENTDFSLYDTVLIGCGMGTDEKNMDILEKAITQSRKNLIIDADGLNLLSKNISLLKKKQCNIILTPHPLEFSRLCGETTDEVLKNRVYLSKEFAKKYDVCVILKTAHTVVAYPGEVAYINSTGNEGMGKGGSGDVLSGMLAGAVCKYDNYKEAALSLTFLHGLAGDIAAEKYGTVSMNAANIIESIPDAIKIFK